MANEQDGRLRYESFRSAQMADPEFQAAYEEAEEREGLSLALTEARRSAGLTQAELAQRLGVSQAQVARIEKRGYESYTLNTLRRYVAALGSGYAVEVRIQRPRPGTGRVQAS